MLSIVGFRGGIDFIDQDLGDIEVSKKVHNFILLLRKEVDPFGVLLLLETELSCYNQPTKCRKIYFDKLLV